MDPEAKVLLEGMKRSLDILVKLKLQEIRGDRSQKEMIQLLGDMNCSTNDIARFLDASVGSVAPVLSRSKNKNGMEKGKIR